MNGLFPEKDLRKLGLPAGLRSNLADLIDCHGAIPAVEPDVAWSAALAICARATDAGDARLLMEACGLITYQPGKAQTYAFGRRS